MQNEVECIYTLILSQVSSGTQINYGVVDSLNFNLYLLGLIESEM